MRKKIIYIAILVVMIIATVLPFTIPQPVGDTISGTGTVTFISLEGGFYGIRGDDGLNYDPTNLENDFRQDGLRVTFTGIIRTGMANIRQWGTIVELTRIGKLQ